MCVCKETPTTHRTHTKYLRVTRSVQPPGGGCVHYVYILRGATRNKKHYTLVCPFERADKSVVTFLVHTKDKERTFVPHVLRIERTFRKSTKTYTTLILSPSHVQNDGKQALPTYSTRC